MVNSIPLPATVSLITTPHSRTQLSLPSLGKSDFLRKLKVVIISIDEAGFGDYVSGMRTMETLMSYGCEKNHLTLFVTVLETARQLNKDNFNVEVLNPSGRYVRYGDQQQLFERIQKLNPNLVIVTPVNLTSPDFLSPLNIPILTVLETTRGYGNYRALGFEDGELGIHIDPNLEAWSRQPECSQAEKRLNHLVDLPARVSRGILGAGYSEEAIKKFAQTSLFYIGYANNPDSLCVIRDQRAFVLAIAQFTVQFFPNSNLVFLFLGRDRTKEFCDDNFNEAIAKQGITEVEGVSLGRVDESTDTKEDSPGRQLYLTPSIRGGRKVRIIYGSFNRIWINPLFKSSEKQVITGGDNFLFEALSARKWIVYHVLHHKVWLFRQLEQLMKDRLTSLGESFKGCYDEDAYQAFIPDGIAQFFGSLQTNQKMSGAWDAVMDEISSKHAFSTKFKVLLDDLE